MLIKLSTECVDKIAYSNAVKTYIVLEKRIPLNMKV